MSKKDERIFYVYLWLRSKDSEHGPKLSPYYVGKGQGGRYYGKTGRPAGRPRDKSYIVFVQEGLTEEEAFALETYCIKLYGRIDIGTGILHNRTDGGEGRSGYIASEETRRKMSRRGSANPLWGRTGEQSARWGKKHAQETKEQLSMMKQGEKNPNWGKTHSPETRRRISEGQLGNRRGESTKQKISLSKAKYLYELIDPDGEVYITDNLFSFSEQYGLTNAALHLVVNGKQRQHKGWTGRIVERLK
jgi:hypothetical protein